ncbi:MAG: alpha/beta hydrolase [Paludibacter sp.]
MKIRLYLLLFIAGLAACRTLNEPNALVPATVDQDTTLPSVSITVAGTSRRVHIATFGDATNPVLFVIHGSASDMRPYLPLQVLSDKYYVVFWDMRGNGLSERCTKEELRIDNMAEEIHAMKQVFSPDKQVNIISHSWSAFFVARYMALYPEEVNQSVLIEPNGLKDIFMKDVGQALNLFTGEYMDMMYSYNYLSPQSHEELDFQALPMLTSGVRNFFCDPDHRPQWPVWRLGAYALIVWESSISKNGAYSFDYTTGLNQFPRKVLLVGSECSPIGYEFQKKFHQPLFRQADLLYIPNSGHRILTEQFDTLVQGIKSYFTEYK